jgi:predicted NAD/FAD-binding protein
LNVKQTAIQPRVQALQGVRNTWFCGAHLRHGFHEDGLAGAVNVCRLLGTEAPWRVPAPAFPDFAAAPVTARYPVGLRSALGQALAGPEAA